MKATSENEVYDLGYAPPILFLGKRLSDFTQKSLLTILKIAEYCSLAMNLMLYLYNKYKILVISSLLFYNILDLYYFVLSVQIWFSEYTSPSYLLSSYLWFTFLCPSSDFTVVCLQFALAICSYFPTFALQSDAPFIQSVHSFSVAQSEQVKYYFCAFDFCTNL